MAQTASQRTDTSPGCLGAGGPVWYAVLTVSFLSCSMNPVGAAGLALRILTPHDMYSKPVGWLLTAGSFVIAMTGFIATERIAYLERRRRSVEIASLLAGGSGLLAFALGFTLPMYIMWPIAGVLVLIGACGFRAAKGLPVPGMPGDLSARDGAGATRRQDGRTGGAGRVARDSLSPSDQATPARKRRRRRRKRRSPNSSPPSGTSSND